MLKQNRNSLLADTYNECNSLWSIILQLFFLTIPRHLALWQYSKEFHLIYHRTSTQIREIWLHSPWLYYYMINGPINIWHSCFSKKKKSPTWIIQLPAFLKVLILMFNLASGFINKNFSAWNRGFCLYAAEMWLRPNALFVAWTHILLWGKLAFLLLYWFFVIKGCSGYLHHFRSLKGVKIPFLPIAHKQKCSNYFIFSYSRTPANKMQWEMGVVSNTALHISHIIMSKVFHRFLFNFIHSECISKIVLFVTCVPKQYV